MFKRLAVTVAAFALVGGLSGCARSNATKEDMIKRLMEPPSEGAPGASKTLATCVADALFEKYADDQDTLNDISSAQADDEDGLRKDVRDAIDTAIEDCRDNPDGGDGDTTTTGGDSDSETTTTAG